MTDPTKPMDEAIARGIRAAYDLGFHEGIGAAAKAVQALKPAPDPYASWSSEERSGIRWDAFDDACAAILALTPTK